MIQPSSGAPLPPESGEALQAALGAEHAAVWVHELVSAFLPPALSTPLAEGSAAHRTRRDATSRLLTAAGQVPRPAEPAYVPPQPVVDQASAIALLVTAEVDCCIAWRATLDRTDDAGVRKSASEALTASAVRAARWRKAGGLAPVIVAMPGVP